MVVYVDILIFINTIVNYAVLSTAERLLKRDCRLYRLIIGSFIGALFSMNIFLNSESRLLPWMMRIISSAAITLAVFGWRSYREFFKAFLCTAAAATVYCGFYILFYQLFKPPNMIIVNDVPYIQVDPLWLIALTGVIYVIILLLYKAFSERLKSTVVSLRFTVGGRSFGCIAKIDTGCNLREPFSSAPVIIADSSVFTIGGSTPKRIIPYTALGGSSYLYAVKADSVTIDKKPVGSAVYIACAELHNDQYQAIINSEIVR